MLGKLSRQLGDDAGPVGAMKGEADHASVLFALFYFV